MSNTALVLTGLAGVLLLLLLILKARLHPIMSLMVAAIAVALVAGIPVDQVMPTLITGMGATLGSVAIIVALGAMLGRLIEVSGGADVLAEWLLDKFGEKRGPWALGATGFLFGIPVFFDVGLIVLIPIVLSVARRVGGNMLAYALPIGGTMLTVHVLLPPHPGPVAGAQALGADIGMVVIFGLICAIPVWFVAQWVSARMARRVLVEIPPSDEAGAPAAAAAEIDEEVAKHGGSIDEDAVVSAASSRLSTATAPRALPSFGTVLALILTPLVLIMSQTVSATLLDPENDVRRVFALIGASPFALLVGVVLASFVLGRNQGWGRPQLESIVNSALPPVAVVILITGAGGMFGKVLAESGVGTAVADMLTGTGLPVLLLAFVMSALLRAAQGSATVAIIAAAGIVAPITLPMGLSSTQTALVAIAISAGALTLSHVNDSGFWLFSKYFGLDTGVALRTWTVLTTILGTVGFLCAAAIWAIIGLIG